MNRRAALGLGILVLVAASCGGRDTETAPVPEYSSGGEQEEDSRGGMQVSGIMGTISTFRINEKFEMKLFAFERCFAERQAAVEFIGGGIEFYFRVAMDGSVAWVYPRRSTLGDRQTERCLLEHVKKMRFPEPRGGGEAEAAWGFERDPNPDVRAPVELNASAAASAVGENAESIRACSTGSSPITVTAYVAPGGQVMAAGASAPDQAAADDSTLDCVTEAVSGWTMADPGSYPAKISFTVP